MSGSLPAIECDFNARGWSGEVDDICYYVFNREMFDVLEKVAGMRLFIFMYEDVEKTEIVGCEAVLEYHQDNWRVRPDKSTWYSGTVPRSMSV